MAAVPRKVTRADFMLFREMRHWQNHFEFGN